MAIDGQIVRIGSDIGGTFTDVAMEIGTELFSTKVLTNYSAPEQAILDGIETVIKQAGIPVSQIDMLVHGTTLATNALIERRGAKTAFLTTEGFRDSIEMRTENRFEQYDLNIVLPRPLIERDARFVAAGRISSSGIELVPLDEQAVMAFAETVKKNGYESVAIGFIHAYINPAHEIRARDIILSILPDISISISSEVSPQMREYERFNTVCSNAFVKPLVSSYLERLVARTQDMGLTCPLFLIHSGGGLMSADTAMDFPVRLLESGPAGGAIFAADIAARHGLNQVLSYDMGGTTAKVCLIENATPQTARTFEVARTYRFKKGSGMPISIPVIEMVEIGAGGGSIAHVDGMNQIRVGPESAGSEPGPACYQRGGVQPAVTDADLMLGRLDPDNFAGGHIKLSAENSKNAIKDHISDQLGQAPVASAVGMCEIVDENMANAARVHAVESGKELTNFSMIAFGGAAPLHAARLCEKLGINTLLIPPGAGVGSAIGFLRAPFGYESVRGTYHSLREFDAVKVNAILADQKDEAEDIVRAGLPEGDLETEIRAYMRYQGQGWEIPFTLDRLEFCNNDAAFFKERFETEYRRMFGRVLEDVNIEILSWSVRVEAPVTTPERVDHIETRHAETTGLYRDIFDARVGRFVSSAVIERNSLRLGDIIPGPAAIVEQETTTIVTASFDVTMQADGCLRLERKG